MTKTHYKTKQMDQLIDILKKHSECHMTVNDIYQQCKEDEIKIGVTTIYRHLGSLVEQGVVAKCVVDHTTSACYEYVGDDVKHIVTYHCKCEKCGKLYHVQCKEIDGLRSHMLNHHHFEIDLSRTVFYGVCESCRNQ